MQAAERINTMKQTINEYQFRDAFLMSEERKNTFTYDALTALFNYFEELEADTGEEMEFDMTAICCEWTEYNSIDDVLSDYSATLDFEFIAEIIGETEDSILDRD